MNISGANQIHGPHGLQGPHSRPAAGKATGPQSARPQAADQLDISAEASAAADAAQTDAPIRADRVAEIRSQIASGSYETPDKLDAALDRLLDEIG